MGIRTTLVVLSMLVQDGEASEEGATETLTGGPIERENVFNGGHESMGDFNAELKSKAYIFDSFMD